MENYRIKVKIGEHEFEADGPADAVQSQFEMFKQLIANQPKPIDTTKKEPQQEESMAPLRPTLRPSARSNLPSQRARPLPNSQTGGRRYCRNAQDVGAKDVPRE